MGDINYGTCNKCGKKSQLNRICERFSFPCECHSPNHFIIHDLCDDCYYTFKEDPNKICIAEISVDTFNTFLKAHAYYYGVYHEKTISFKDLNPVYIIDDTCNKPIIQITCTYNIMCYLGKIYAYYTELINREENDE